MSTNPMTCDVCHGESGGEYVGVASIPGVAMSIAWCSECLKRDAAPVFVFEHDFVFVAEGKLENLNLWARSRVTWVEGKYIGFDEYVKRITPEEVQRQLKEYEQAEKAREQVD